MVPKGDEPLRSLGESLICLADYTSMEGFDIHLGRSLKPSFDEAPDRFRRRISGVDYLHIRGLQGGDLFVTREGWPGVSCLVPGRWFTGGQFRKPGQALAGATGAVYRVPVPHPARREGFALVVKFSRFGQDVGLTIADDQIGDPAFRDRLASAEFLPPFQEFAHLHLLRQQCRTRFATQAPLAIYSPPTRYHAWQLGRKSHLHSAYARQLGNSQDNTQEKIAYDLERIYILLYRWMDGLDAEQAHRSGLLSFTQMTRLARDSAATLRELGWCVLDHKPRHLILRRHPKTGRPLVRHNRPQIGLIDYELLYPNPPHHHPIQ